MAHRNGRSVATPLVQKKQMNDNTTLHKREKQAVEKAVETIIKVYGPALKELEKY